MLLISNDCPQLEVLNQWTMAKIDKYACGLNTKEGTGLVNNQMFIFIPRGNMHVLVRLYNVIKNMLLCVSMNKKLKLYYQGQGRKWKLQDVRLLMLKTLRSCLGLFYCFECDIPCSEIPWRNVIENTEIQKLIKFPQIRLKISSPTSGMHVGMN